MLFGSHLYGTSTINSDTDYKGIFLPNKKDIILGNVPKSINSMTKTDTKAKNTENDVDTEIYSLHYFLHLACEGQTVALDMLHAPKNMILTSSAVWDEIVMERHRFYTCNLQAFIGYARKQAAKYGIRGSRLSEAKMVYDYLAENDLYSLKKMGDLWEDLPTGEHIEFVTGGKKDYNEEFYQVCGKKIQKTAKVSNCLNILATFITSYGHRAMLAAENKGIDWKAISHAVRAAEQVKEVLKHNTITFPLKNAETILSIKNGELDYNTEVAPLLESLMDEVENLSEKSKLPKKVDRKFWDNFLVRVIEDYVL